MKIKNWRIFTLSLFLCLYCLVHLCFKPSANAQYTVQDYYRNITQITNPISAYDTAIYSNNYPWLSTYNYRNVPYVPKTPEDDWILRPMIGNTVFSVSVGSTLSIHGTYFSAHTNAGVNFERTLSWDSSIYSMPFMQSTQSMYGSVGGQSSFISPASNYFRQILQFSPVLHGPLLNYSY